MTKLTRLSTYRPVWTLVLVLAVSAYLATGLGFSEVRPLLEGELPESNPVVHDYNLFAQRNPHRNFYVLGIESREPSGIWNPRTLAKIIEVSDEASYLDGALPNVQSIATWEHVTGNEDTIDIERLMPEVPEGAAEMARVRQVVQSDPLIFGRLVSEDERMALVRLTFRDDAAPDVIHSGLVQLRDRFADPEKIIIFGREYSNVEMNKAVDQNIRVVLPLAGLLLLAFFYLSFGRWQAVWLAFTMIVLSVVDFLGLMGVLGIPQTVLSSTVPVILIVVLGSYVVHLLRRVYEEAERMPWERAVSTAVATTGRPVAIAAATTALGFATLAVFQIYSIREFGMLAAAGVLICGVISITWLPAALLVFCSRAPEESMRLRRPFLAFIEWITEAAVGVSSARRSTLLCVTTAVVLLSVAGLSRLSLGDSPSKYYASGHPVRDAFETFVEHFGGDGFLFVEFSAPAGKTAFDPDFLGRVHAFQRDAEEIEHVGYASSVVDRVFMRTNRIMNGDDPAYERVPETERLAASYAEVFRWTAPETLAEMLEDVDSPRRLVVDVFAEVEDSVLIDKTVQDLRALVELHFPSPEAGSAIFGGEWFVWIAQNEYIVKGKLLNLALSILLVGAVCLAAMRTVRLAAISVLPAGLSALMLFGIMGAIGIRLNMTTCVLTAMVVGIGVDFAVHFLVRYEEIKSKAGSGADPDLLRAATIRCAASPILFDSFSNVVAFSVCMVSALVPVRNFGWLICFSMLACAATTLMLLPSLVPRGEGKRDIVSGAAAESHPSRLSHSGGGFHGEPLSPASAGRWGPYGGAPLLARDLFVVLWVNLRGRLRP